MATFNLSGGRIEVVASNPNEAVTLAVAGNGLNKPNTVTTINVTGGTFTSNGRFIFGSNNSGSFNDGTFQNARVEMTMTGGLLWAQGLDGIGTLQFAGGKIALQGGIIKGGDMSTRDGWNRTAYGGTGGTNFLGGVVQIDTNLSEGTLFVVPPGVDPLEVVGIPLNRGQSRVIGATLPIYGGPASDGVPGVDYPVGERFYSTLPDSTVRVWMDTSGPVTQANAFASPKGDYNLDGVVNRADFLLWQNQLGNTYLGDNLLPEESKVPYYGADGNGDGVVTQADFDVWAASIGQAAVGGPYAWAQARTIDVASGSQTQAEAGYLTLTFTTASSVTKTGAGTLVMDVANTSTGPTNVNAGTVQVASPGALQSSPVTVQSGGRLALPGDVRITVPVGNLSVDQSAGGGSVDVGVGEIDVFRGLDEADLRADLIAGRSGGSWAGATGITSSAAAASGGTRAVGYVVAADGSARVSFAASGDADLSGAVNVFDLVSINSSGRYGTGAASGWSQGDFNYDGATNVFDLVSVNTAGVYGQGNYFPAGPAAGATGPVATVPEPSSAGLLSLAAIVATGVAVRRRRPRSPPQDCGPARP
jgi:autotransporter-associated beta strand protein